MDNNNELSGIVHTIKELEESRNEFLCENQELHETIADLEAELEDLDNVHRQNLTKIDEYESTIQRLQREHKNLQNCVQQKDMEIADLRGVYREMEDMKRHNENLYRDLTACQNKLKKLKDTIHQLEESIQEKDQCISRHEGELAQLQQKLAELKRHVDALTEENLNLARCYDECRKSIEEAQLESDRLNEKLRLCEMARQKLEDCCNKNQSYIKQLKSELSREQENNRKLESRIKSLEEELARYRKEIARYKEETMALNEEIDDKHSELEECSAELKRKIAEFENYKNTITNLKQKIMSNRNNKVGCGSMLGDSRSHMGARNKSQCGLHQRGGRPATARQASSSRNPCAKSIKKPHVSKKPFKTKKNC